MSLQTQPDFIEVPILQEGLDAYCVPTEEDILSSMEANDGYVVMTSCAQRSDYRNQMHRVYPFAVLQKQFEEFQEFVDERSAVGELDHSNEGVVALKSSAILITKQWWQDNPRIGKKEWWVNFQILSGNLGPGVLSLVKDKVKFGISSRGIGSVEHNHSVEADVVQSDFVVICWDVVTRPSTQWANPFIRPTVKIPRMIGVNEGYNHNVYNRYMNNKYLMLQERAAKVRTKGQLIV